MSEFKCVVVTKSSSFTNLVSKRVLANETQGPIQVSLSYCSSVSLSSSIFYILECFDVSVHFVTLTSFNQTTRSSSFIPLMFLDNLIHFAIQPQLYLL